MEKNKEYTVAPSYKDWETVGTPLVENGKMYTKIKKRCDRCVNGVYVCRIENGMPVPHPNCNGVCFQCGGTGYEVKKVRLYTIEEAAKMEKRNEAARIKRQEEAEAKMKAEYSQKKAKWIEENGFNENGVTYIVTGDSYSIKDELKTAGFTFNYVLKWHKAEPDPNYSTIEVKMEDVVEFSAWGTGSYKESAKDYIEKLLQPSQPGVDSEWVGEIGSRITFNVTFVKKYGYQSKFGYTNIYTFNDEDNNILTWFSTVEIKKEIGDEFTLVGTVKDHTEYKGIKQTVLSRCKVK